MEGRWKDSLLEGKGDELLVSYFLALLREPDVVVIQELQGQCVVVCARQCNLPRIELSARVEGDINS